MLALDELRELGTDFVSLGNATLRIIAATAELESTLMAERTRAGPKYARRHGTRSERPLGRRPQVFNRPGANVSGTPWRP